MPADASHLAADLAPRRSVLTIRRARGVRFGQAVPMGEEPGGRPVWQPPIRVAVGAATGVALWIGAWVCLAVAVIAPMGDFDRPERSTGQTDGWAPFVLAVLFFTASGPVAFAIGRKVVLLALPALLFAVLILGLVVAYNT